MPGGRFSILQRLGLLRDDAVKMDLPQAGEALADAQTLAGKGRRRCRQRRRTTGAS